MRIHGFIEAAENGRCEAVQHALRASSSGNTQTCPSFCIRISSPRRRRGARTFRAIAFCAARAKGAG